MAIKLLGYTPDQLAGDPALRARVHRAMKARENPSMKWKSANLNRLMCRAIGREFEPSANAFDEIFDTFADHLFVPGTASRRAARESFEDFTAAREALKVLRELVDGGWFVFDNPPNAA